MEENKLVKLVRPLADGLFCERSGKLSYIHQAPKGINNPWYVEIQGVGHGYLKNCAATDPAMEQLEVWLAFLGSRLGMKMAETWLVLDEDDVQIGCFSRDVAGKDGCFATADEIKTRWLNSPNPMPSWAADAAEIYAAAPKAEPLPEHRLSVVTDTADLEKVLRFVYGVLSCDGEYPVSDGFVDMVLFDCLVGQKDRNMHGFGLVCDLHGTVEMSALFDNASVLLPGLDASMVGFCNILCEPRLLARAVMNLFPQQAQGFIQRLYRFRREEQRAVLLRQQSFLPNPYHDYMVRRLNVNFRLPNVAENKNYHKEGNT